MDSRNARIIATDKDDTVAKGTSTQRRPTQGERTAITRSLLMDATISVLDEDGLAGATTVRIQERAGVSRGRMLHHFPEREQLLVAAVQHLAVVRFQELRDASNALEGEKRIYAAIDRLWEMYSGPLFWAAMELWIGARTEVSLRDALLPEERRLGLVVKDMADELFGEEFVANPGYVALREILISSMRGVAMTYSFDCRSMTTDPHRAMWYSMAKSVLLPDS